MKWFHCWWLGKCTTKGSCPEVSGQSILQDCCTRVSSTNFTQVKFLRVAWNKACIFFKEALLIPSTLKPCSTQSLSLLRSKTRKKLWHTNLLVCPQLVYKTKVIRVNLYFIKIIYIQKYIYIHIPCIYTCVRWTSQLSVVISSIAQLQLFFRWSALGKIDGSIAKERVWIVFTPSFEGEWMPLLFPSSLKHTRTQLRSKGSAILL